MRPVSSGGLLTALCLTLLAGALARAAEPVSRGSVPPNILFILSDDQRWDTAGFTGNTLIQTPNLDRIASEGAKLSQYYCVAPLCCPSRATILSGLYPHQAGNQILQNNLWTDFSEATPTVASHLNDGGYVTCFVGKAHLGGDPRSWGFQNVPVWLRRAASEYEEPRLITAGRERRFRGQNITTVFARAAADFITEQASGTKPWFLYVSTTSPHGPDCTSCQGEFPYNMQDIENTPPPGVPPGRLGLFNWADYYSKITHLDNEIGALLNAIDESGQAANTYVFFTSDNGLTSTEFEQPGKGTWYDESARVLACGRGPGITPGTDVTAPLVSVDWLPTFLEIAGLPIPSGLEGKSMLPALQGGTPLRSTAYGEVHANSFPHWQMVRSYTGVSAGYKYIYSVALDVEHLYHLDSDPFELTDIIGSAPQAVLDELRQTHQSWLTATP